jgi:hypothetical protein
MIYSDGIHLISGVSLTHLHEYCKLIKINRCWFHYGSRFEHYDIPKLRRARFFQDHPEVQKVSSKAIVKILKNRNGYLPTTS